MIAIIDYGVGNLYSLKSSLRYLGIESEVTSEEKKLKAADRLILPGVGAFADAYAKLADAGLVDVVKTLAADGKPLLGICLGMQLLFDESLEYGRHDGLGLIGGVVAPLADDLPTGLKVPQMGWNALQLTGQNKLFKYTKQGDYVYFVHSYYAKAAAEDVIATCEYGISVTAAAARSNVYGTQFHPEKSGEAGLKILRAFSEV